jgi:hypothetical protein
MLLRVIGADEDAAMRHRSLGFAVPWVLFASDACAEQIFQSGFEGPAGCVDVAAAAGGALDIASIAITPQYKLNGKAFPVDNSRFAAIFLADADGIQVALGTTNVAPTAVRILPGLYDVVYEYVIGNDIPRNHGARLRRNLWLDADATLTIDVPSVGIDAEFRHNGMLFDDDPLQAGNLTLQGVYYGGEVQLGSTSQQTATITLLPGAYQAVYRHDAGHDVPENTGATLGRHDLDAAGTHAFDVASVLVNVTFRLDGGAFPNSVYERGDFTLGGAAGDTVALYDSTADTVQRRIVPGTYSVHWQRTSGGAIVPINDDAIVAGPFVVVSATSLLADVQTVDTSGAFTLNGAAPPASVYDNGEIFLVDPNTGAKTVIGQTQDQQYDTRIVAQHYAIGYRIVAGGAMVPSNPDTALVADWNAAAQPQRDIDVPVGGYSANLTLNGNAFPASIYDSGRLYLRPLASGLPATVLGTTDDGFIDRRLLAGSYFVTYTIEAGGTVPHNLNVPIPGTRNVVAGSDPAADAIAITSVTLERDVTLDGAAFPAGSNAHLRLRAKHAWGDDNFAWGDSDDGTLSVALVPGAYELLYQHATGTTIPRDNNKRVACWNVLP